MMRSMTLFEVMSETGTESNTERNVNVLMIALFVEKDMVVRAVVLKYAQ